ncbi:unnamed protein product [Closterium sp. NIES-54]
MLGAVGDAGVVDTLEARLEDAKRRHEANEYGSNLLLAVIEAGICSVWAEEHPARPASPRPVNNEGGVDVGVNVGGDQVGINAGGTSRQRGVIHADEVGSVQVRGMRSSAADEAMHEAERPSELLAQANYVAPKPTKDANKKKSAKDSSRGGGSRRRECWLCGEPDHLSFKCSDCTDFDDDDAKGGRGRSGSHRPRRVKNQPCKEKQSTKSSTSAKDADSFAGGKGQDDKEVSCSLVGVVEPTISLVPEGGEDFHTMAAVVQANPADVQGRGTVALQGEAGREVLIPDVLYVPSVRANLLSAGQLKENGVKLQEDGDGMLLVSAMGDVLGWASYTGRVICTDLRPCSANSTMPTTEVVALRAIVSVTKSTPDRLAHVGMNTIWSSAKHEVATGLDLKLASGADLPCVSCVGGKLAWHTFPDQGSDANDVLAVMHVDLCGPFRVAAKDGSLYFLLLKDRKTRYVGVPWEAVHRLREWKGDRPRHDLPLHPAAERHGGARDEDGGGVGANDATAHGRAAPLVAPRSTAGCLGPQLPGAVEAAAGDDAIPAADWEEAQPINGTCVGLHGAVIVPGGKLKPKARWGLHLGVSAESKGWELLDIANNRVVITSDVVFYENMSLEVWKSEHGPVSGQMPSTPPTDTSTATFLVLAEVGEPAAEDVEDASSPSTSCAPLVPPLVADVHRLTPTSASGDEGSNRGSAADDGEVGKGGSGMEEADRAEEPTSGEQLAGTPTVVQQDAEGSDDSDDGGEAEESTDSDVVEVQGGPRRTGRLRRPPDFFVPADFTTVSDMDSDDLAYDDAEDDDELLELDPDMHANLKNRWDIFTMMVKEALASWKGVAVKSAMKEKIRSLVGMGTWCHNIIVLTFV